MNRLGTGIMALVFVLSGGYQALYPEKLIRHNQRWSWQPRWMRERAGSAPNVLGARIAGAACCVAGVGMLLKTLGT